MTRDISCPPPSAFVVVRNSFAWHPLSQCGMATVFHIWNWLGLALFLLLLFFFILFMGLDTVRTHTCRVPTHNCDVPKVLHTWNMHWHKWRLCVIEPCKMNAYLQHWDYLWYLWTGGSRLLMSKARAKLHCEGRNKSQKWKREHSVLSCKVERSTFLFLLFLDQFNKTERFCWFQICRYFSSLSITSGIINNYWSLFKTSVRKKLSRY